VRLEAHHSAVRLITGLLHSLLVAKTFATRRLDGRIVDPRGVGCRGIGHGGVSFGGRSVVSRVVSLSILIVLATKERDNEEGTTE